VGRNYINHAKELNNQIPKSPVIFMKPATCLVSSETKTIQRIVNEEIHYETELVLVVGREGYYTESDNIDNTIMGYSLGLDLTLRQVQRQLTEKGLPWEKSKSFDHSSPIGKIIPINSCDEIRKLEFACYVNNEKRQHGQVSNMIFSFEAILKEISRYWKLIPGDLIYTGTPEGVGVLKSGDIIRIQSEQTGPFEWKMG
jgi:2-keto-4-pentenoate hydratase/2-oxohepta-3-ene-1,7-dioic acid hydratase in catechol pathway